MDLWDSLGLGALQGLTEFLPVSSSAHLSLLQYFLDISDTPRFFDVMLHIGTLLAVLVQYRTALVRIPTSNESSSTLDRRRLLVRLFALVVLATLPAVAAGALFRPTKPSSPGVDSPSAPTWRNRVADMREYSSQRPWTVLGFLTVTGFVLLAGSRARGGEINADRMRWPHALVIGVAQALSALMPGLSRSGMTVSTGMMIGLRGDWAVHFSLLMSIPAVLGAVVLKARDADPTWVEANVTPTIVGTITSAIVGWFCIQLLLGSVRRGRWWWYSIYVWALVLAVATWLSFHS